MRLGLHGNRVISLLEFLEYFGEGVIVISSTCGCAMGCAKLKIRDDFHEHVEQRYAVKRDPYSVYILRLGNFFVNLSLHVLFALPFNDTCLYARFTNCEQRQKV